MAILYIYLLGCFIMFLWTLTDDFAEMRIGEHLAYPQWMIVVSSVIMSWWGIYQLTAIFVKGLARYIAVRYQVWRIKRRIDNLHKKLHQRPGR